MTTKIKVGGMSCEGCVRAVTGAIKHVAPDARVEVDLEHGIVSVDGVDDETVLKRAVDDAGFDYLGRAA